MRKLVRLCLRHATFNVEYLIHDLIECRLIAYDDIYFAILYALYVMRSAMCGF